MLFTDHLKKIRIWVGLKTTKPRARHLRASLNDSRAMVRSIVLGRSGNKWGEQWVAEAYRVLKQDRALGCSYDGSANPSGAFLVAKSQLPFAFITHKLVYCCTRQFSPFLRRNAIDSPGFSKQKEKVCRFRRSRHPGTTGGNHT